MPETEDDICDYSTDENDAVEAIPFTCDRCCYKTQRKWLMDRHKSHHAREKPFRCPTCRFSSKDSSLFVDHLANHSPKSKILQCCFCPFKAMPSMMKSHIVQHGPAERLDCSECEYWTNSIKSMTEHIEAYHTKKYSCQSCAKVLTKYALTKHVKKVHNSKKAPVDSSLPTKTGSLLKKTVASRPGLTIVPVSRHGKTQQKQVGKNKAGTPIVPVKMPVVRLERCQVSAECWSALEASSKSVGTKSAIRRSVDHAPEDKEPAETGSESEDAQETQTNVEVPVELPKSKQIRKPVYFPALVSEFGDTLLTCSICDYQTRKEHLLKRHAARHDDIMPFACRRCSFENVSVYEFANHMLAHEGMVKEDVYSCFFCNFWTHKKHHVPIHLERHRGTPREFDCPECEEVLTTKGGLQTHFEKLHCEALDCQFCGKNMTKFELNLHIKEHADEIQKPKRRSSDSGDDQPGPSGEARASSEVRVKPSNPLGKKYKPKPLSRKKLDLKADSGLGSKMTKNVEETPIAADSRPKPKPLSKKEPGRTTSKAQAGSSANGPHVSVYPQRVANQKPGPLSRKISPKLDGAAEACVTSEEAPGVAKKRKRSPSPPEADSSRQEPAAKDMECRYCDYKTQISSLMDRHQEKHKVDAPFKCGKCNYETSSSAKMSWHYMYHFPSQTDFLCPYCTYSTKYKSALPGHIDRHRLTRFFDCSKCQFSANNAQGVKKHYERMHVDKYACTICDKVMTKHAMMKHLKKRHPLVYNSHESALALGRSHAKLYLEYMRPVDVAADSPKKKRPTPLVEEAADTMASTQKPCYSQGDTGIKAAQQALAREIFGDLSDSDEGNSKQPCGPSNAVPSMVKSNASDSDTDSDSDVIFAKLSCPKCDFTTSQIADVKVHYRDMHEIEYSCNLCRGIYTKHEMTSHLKTRHPSIDPEHYGSFMTCRAPEKLRESRAPVKIEPEDSGESDDEANASVTSDKASRTAVSYNSVIASKAPQEEHSTSGSSKQAVSSMGERVVGPEVVAEPQVQEPMETEEPSIENEQDSAANVVELAVPQSSEPHVNVAEAVDNCEPIDTAHIPEGSVQHDATAKESECGSSNDLPHEEATEPVDQLKSADVELKPPEERSETGYKCKECSFQTLRMSVLQRHTVKHKSGAPLVCPQCHFQSNSPYDFLLHWTKHFPDQIAFRCCFCAFATVSKLDLALHFCVHNNTRVFDCYECDYSTSTKAFFEGHIWNIHKKVTCQKCQESMVKTELLDHKCMSARDDDALNSSDDGPKLAMSGSQKPATEQHLSLKQVPSVSSDDPSREKLTEVSTSRQIIARESFKTSELRKFSFLRKRDDLLSPDTVPTSRFPTVEEREEPSPSFESLSAESSFAEADVGAPIAGVVSSSEIDDPRLPGSVVNKDVSGGSAEPVTGGEPSSISRAAVDGPTNESSGEREEVPKSAGVVDSREQEVCRSEAKEDSEKKTALAERPSLDSQPVSDEPTGESLSREDSFAPEGSFSGVPIIDISGRPEIPDSPAKPSQRAAASWTEPIDSDDDVNDENDHNYFVTPRRSKSSTDQSPRSDPPRSSPIQSEEFSGDYCTEVVFDNGMTALVLEVSDSSDEEM